MKALNIFFIIFSTSILFVNAQDFKGGIFAGMNVSQVDGDEYAGFNKAGLILGGFVNRDFTKTLTGQLEMIYIGKGSKKPVNPDKGQFDYRFIASDYIEIPVLLKIKYEKLKLFFETGLSYGILFSSREEDENGEINIPRIGPFKKNEFGLILGLNFSITENLSFNTRFAYSILPIANKALLTTWRVYGGSYNRALEFTLRYQFLKDGE